MKSSHKVFVRVITSDAVMARQVTNGSRAPCITLARRADDDYLGAGDGSSRVDVVLAVLRVAHPVVRIGFNSLLLRLGRPAPKRTSDVALQVQTSAASFGSTEVGFSLPLQV